MSKEISFIAEFDEMNESQLNELNEFLTNNMIKFHILKSNNELKKDVDLKQALIDIREICTSNMFAYDDGEDCGVDCCVDGFKILQIIYKVLGDEK